MTDPTWLILATGFLLGLRHALDPDHVTAVTHFISIDTNPRHGAWFGLRWGLGHAITVLILGTLVLVLRWELTATFERAAEVFVGMTLIGLAAWRLNLLWRERPHQHLHLHAGDPPHLHPHTHEPASGHVHPYAPTIVGMIHGAAGSVAIVVLIPLSIAQSAVLAFLYICLFSAGCLLSMGVYGYCAGRWYHASAAWRRGFRWLVIVTSLMGIGLGLFWILRHV